MLFGVARLSLLGRHHQYLDRAARRERDIRATRATPFDACAQSMRSHPLRMSCPESMGRQACHMRTPFWVWLVVGIWILMLPAFLLIALGTPAWR